MTFLSDTSVTLTGKYSEILIIEDTIFDNLESDNLVLYEGSTTLVGSTGVIFYAGMKLEGRFYNIKLLSGAILLK